MNMIETMIYEAADIVLKDAHKTHFDIDELQFAVVTGLTAHSLPKDTSKLDAIANYLRGSLVAVEALIERVKAAKESDDV